MYCEQMYNLRITMLTEYAKTKAGWRRGGNGKQVGRLKKGSALVFVVLATAILLVGGTSILALGVGTRSFSARDEQVILAHNAADAGFADVMVKVNQTLAAGTWNDSSLPATTSNVTLPGSASQSYSYAVTKDSSGVYNIAATGYCGNIQRTVRASLNLSGSFVDGLLVSGTIVMKNNGTITGTCGTLSTAAAAISLGSTTIQGDAFVGYGGNPATGISGTVSGREYALSSPMTLKMPVVPSSSQTAGPNTNWNTPSNSTLGTAGNTTYYRYIGLTINGTLYISGNVVMYVNGNIVDSGNGIQVNNNSTLQLYVSGNMNSGNGVSFAGANGDPSTLKVYGVGNSQTWSLSKNNGTITACLYAPNADITLGKNNLNFTGSIVSKSFTSKNNDNVTYDSRAAATDISDPMAVFTIKRWSE
jgi:hypothetical protein